MTDTRKKDANWQISRGIDGNYSWDAAKLAVLMDIRDELKKLNRVFECPNFVAVPSILREIRRNTSKPRKKVKK